MMNGMEKSLTKHINAYLLFASKSKTAAQKSSSDKTAFWGALRLIREGKLSMIS